MGRTPPGAGPLLRRRLLQDIAEMQAEPYPYIALHPYDHNTAMACLVLTPPGWPVIHLSLTFPPIYPLSPPSIVVNTVVKHPNVLRNSTICASVLQRGADGWTPAYTLRGLAIQLLSFFASDHIEQAHLPGGEQEPLKEYREWSRQRSQAFVCPACGHGTDKAYESKIPSTSGDETLGDNEPRCFVTKTALNGVVPGRPGATLGIGVRLSGGRLKAISSEFELLSSDAFRLLKVRKSIHDIPFEHWLPLPLTPQHWEAVRSDALASLEAIGKAANLASVYKRFNPYSQHEPSALDVIAAFMCDMIVRLNNSTQKSSGTLAHASEKAIEAYFHLYHLLLCVTRDDPSLLEQANTYVAAFCEGKVTKADCGNLGHLLVYLTLTETDLDAARRKSLIKEAITRNVVWLLDKKGADKPELAYLEPDAVSAYRLRETFLGSRPSYRLLMYSELFRRVARADGIEGLFARRGAPPRGAAAAMAEAARMLCEVDNFADFFGRMGVAEGDVPDEAAMTEMLRSCVRESIDRGYSAEAIDEKVALALRLCREPKVGVAPGLAVIPSPWERVMRNVTFFPQ